MNELEKKAKQLKAQYMKDWRAKNPEKVKAIQTRYWLKKAKEQAEGQEKE